MPTGAKISTRTKHIVLKYHHFRSNVKYGRVEIMHTKWRATGCYYYQATFKWSVLYPSIHALRLGLHLVLRATLSYDLSSAVIQNGLNLWLPKLSRMEWCINFHFTFESSNQHTPNILIFYHFNFIFYKVFLDRSFVQKECDNTGISQYNSKSVQRQVTAGTSMKRSCPRRSFAPHYLKIT